MEAWRRAWVDGLQPSLPTEGLEALAAALRRDDARVTQGRTTEPKELSVASGTECRGACPIGFCGWRGLGLFSVGEVVDFYDRVTWEADQRLGEPAGCGHFLRWADGTPRAVLIRELLPLVEAELVRRGAGSPAVFAPCDPMADGHLT